MGESFSDQIGGKIMMTGSPDRIVSLVPSLTELVYYLGLGEYVRGVTKFCVHPVQKPQNVKIVGGTKNFRMDVIQRISPDLILGNKEENYKEGIEELAGKYPVWVSDVNNLEEAQQMVSSVGKLTGKTQEAGELISEVNKRWQGVKQAAKGRVLYLIWHEPLMTAAKGTFIDSVLDHLGFENVLSDYTRYPAVDADKLRELNLDYVFLSSEPFPFAKKHLPFYKKLFPKAQVKLVDGEMFSWYGSRMLYAPKYFKEDVLQGI
ncbi:MAG: helical backbone metal receptor [Cyclobacteriaceae bacterium]